MHRIIWLKFGNSVRNHLLAILYDSVLELFWECARTAWNANLLKSHLLWSLGMKDAFWQIVEKSEAGAEKFWYTHEQKLWRICHTILDCSCAPKIQMEILHRYHLSALNCSLLQGAARGSEPFWPERLEARGDGAFDCKGSILLDSRADEGPLHAAVCNVFTYLSGVLTCTHLSECGVERNQACSHCIPQGSILLVDCQPSLFVLTLSEGTFQHRSSTHGIHCLESR